MTTYFRQVSQIRSRSDYEKIMRTALSKVGEEPFFFLDEFPFDKKPGPLVLIGDIAKPLLEEVKKASPKATSAKGQCLATEDDRLIFQKAAGKMQERVLVASIKAVGVKKAVSMEGGDDGPTDDQKAQADANVAAPQTQPPQQPSPQDKPQDKPLDDKAKLWQEKVKLIKPAFDKLLIKAKGMSNSTWADDLDGTFSQMLQEARTGDFDAALKSLGLLARVMKSEESARAEVKHESSKQLDDSYRDYFGKNATETFGEEGVKTMREQAAMSGSELTEDGHISYALAISKGDWQKKVLLPLKTVIDTLDERKIVDERSRELVQGIKLQVGTARQHHDESGLVNTERGQITLDMWSDVQALDDEIALHFTPESSYKAPTVLVEEAEGLIQQAIDTRPGPNGEPSEEELQEFERMLDKKRKEAEQKIQSITSDIQYKEAEAQRWDSAIKRGEKNLREDLGDMLTKLLEEIKKMQQDRDIRVQRLKSGEQEQHAREELMRKSRPTAKVAGLVKMLRKVQSSLKGGQAQSAVDALVRYGDEFDMDVIATGQGPEYELHRALETYLGDLMFTAQIQGKSVEKALALARQVGKEAARYVKLLD
jgi:hypothetical protein